MKRLTIRDVAERAGVSVGSVSNALNRPDYVAEETLSRIREAIAELGYVRNGAARQLGGGRSSAIGLMALYLGPFFNEVTRGVEAAASADDQLVILCDSGGDLTRENRQLRLLEEQRVLGILMTPSGRSRSKLARQIRARGTPIVLLDHRSASRDQCSVWVDDVQGGRLAAQHLIELGHRRIGLINGPPEITQCVDRRHGFVSALRRANVEPTDADEVDRAPTISAGELAARRFLERRKPPTAIFCINDLMALGAEHAILAAGLRIPDDIAVIGYDDVHFAAMALVPLTSIRQPAYELGHRAAELLLDEASNPDHRHEHVVFTPELVVRESTGGATDLAEVGDRASRRSAVLRF
jgi:LacI family transcriptional regulator